MSATRRDGPIRLLGAVVSGAGDGAFFVGLEWFRVAVRRVANFDPYPGTLNVRLSDAEALRQWRAVRDDAALSMTPPGPEDCGGRLVPILLDDDSQAAVVIPDVTRYGDELLEVIAPDRLRTRLGLRDGDLMSLTSPPGRRSAS